MNCAYCGKPELDSNPLLPFGAEPHWVHSQCRNAWFASFGEAQPKPKIPDACPPEVAELFIEYALKLRRAGWKQYSARAILHRIRWHEHVDKGNREFKCNNNWTSGLSRWAMAEYAELDGLFETREQQK